MASKKKAESKVDGEKVDKGGSKGGIDKNEKAAKNKEKNDKGKPEDKKKSIKGNNSEEEEIIEEPLVEVPPKPFKLNISQMLTLDNMGYDPDIFLNGLLKTVYDELLEEGNARLLIFVAANKNQFPASGCCKIFLKGMGEDVDETTLTRDDALKRLFRYRSGENPIQYWQMKQLYLLFRIPVAYWIEFSESQADELIEKAPYEILPEGGLPYPPPPKEKPLPKRWRVWGDKSIRPLIYGAGMKFDHVLKIFL